ncbi:MAG: protein kinase, partial [Polyangiaceae bacterium]
MRRRLVAGEPASVLELRPVAAHPRPSTLERLQHEHELSSLLGADWAIRATALSRPAGRAVLTLEDPRGELLAQQLGRPWAVHELFPIALALVAALAELHARGIVHGDVRPRNVFVDRTLGRTWLAGFGRSARLARERGSLAPDLERVGSLAHMAPEQTGRLERTVDVRSDLYSLGITLYELLAGRLPFDASTPAEWIQCHRARVPLPLGTAVPAVLAAIVQRLLAKSREDRYQSAR